ncbi:MAG: DNA ligase [Candidatus Hydrogenedentes bacterium]|nr:DNA ligase [Candidatus Hydrogenedentota bacterium]
MPDDLHKYPRTPHIEGSRIMSGDEDLHTEPFSTLENRFLVIEEKVDGANAAISFTRDGELRLQSRGHFLSGGGRERQFGVFKQWANRHASSLHKVLGERYVLYGEWLFAKHTLFYDNLPHYFMEFDLLDTETHCFLSTVRRKEILASLPLVGVPVLYSGFVASMKHLCSLLGRTPFISRESNNVLRRLVTEMGLDVDEVCAQADTSGLMEGLYIKVEDEDVVKERYKFLRTSFLQSAPDTGSKWQDRPIIANQLRKGVDIFAANTSG